MMTDDIREKAIRIAYQTWAGDLHEPDEIALEHMRETIAAYEKALWRPIAEAPEKTAVLVFIPSDSEHYGPWVVTAEELPTEGWQLALTGSYADDGDLPLPPTHFMPLPAPPEVG